MNNMSKKQEIIGLIDADLLDNGTLSQQIGNTGMQSGEGKFPFPEWATKCI